MKGVQELNMEYGYPSSKEAVQRLETELTVARGKNVGVLKIVHGYGSSGRGGKLRTSLRSALTRYQHDGAIGLVVAGEAWSIFDESSRTLMDRYAKLRGDRDLERSNPGITLIELMRTSGKHTK